MISTRHAGMNYRADVDGLRAVAITAVVVFHAFPSVLSHGFLGVDVFFVISGFLITCIIANELGDGRFSLATFYARRIQRIFPPLVTVVAANFLIGWLLLLPTEYEQFGSHMVGGLLFVSNIQFFMETGYFDKAAELKPLLHLWSLSVEEQFYLLWPLILVWLPVTKGSRLLVITVVAIGSFAIQTFLSVKDPSAAFYLPVARFWELMLGAALAVAPARKTELPTGLPSALVIAGCLLIFSSFLFWGEGFMGPRLLSTCGACLVLMSAPDGWFNRFALGNPAIVGLGKISYPLYLWHWPLLSFLRIYAGDDVSNGEVLTIVGLSLTLAWLTYRLIEIPIRFSWPRQRTVPALCVSLVTLCCLGFVNYRSGGFPIRMPEPIRKYVSINYPWAEGARTGLCWLSKDAVASAFDPVCFKARPEQPSIAVWGDSHAGRLYVGISAIFGGHFNIEQFTRDACPPVLGFAYAVCQDSNNYVISRFKQTPPDIVIMFAVWNSYTKNTDARDLDLGLESTTEQLRQIGVHRILLIGPPPQWKDGLPKALAKMWRDAFSMQTLPIFLKTDLVDSAISVDRQMIDVSWARLVTYVSLMKLLCNDNGCMTRVSDDSEGLITADYGHLTKAAAEYVARSLPLQHETNNW